MPKYLLDSNVFIQAKNTHYAFDFCPGFWDSLETANGASLVASVQHVKDELVKGNDDLAKWARERVPGFFLDPDLDTIVHVKSLMNWASTFGFEPGAVAKFADSADLFLIAQAKSLGCAVVTHEMPSGSKKKVKIPSARAELDVPYMGPFRMLRELGVKLVLDGHK